jgi:predicted MFS family arabinose efflux permease
LTPILRNSIVAMSALACFSDAVLIAFYPQFFAQRYGVLSEFHTGAYVACISLAVMVAFPLWARVARRVETLHLLVWTQAAAGVLCLMSTQAAQLWQYWALSMAMFVCKSSYLLMYPYLLRLQSTEQHAGTVGVLSVVVHLVGITGAAVGGGLMQGWGATGCLVFMAAGDFLQMAVCAWLLVSRRAVRVVDNSNRPPHRKASPAIWRLAVLMLVFDFSAYLVGPFFTGHWQDLTGSANQVGAGLAYAVPAAMALLGLGMNHRARRDGRQPRDALLPNLLIGGAGLLLQAAPSVPLLLLGRCLFGWALFQGIVKLETSVFKLSTPEAYATDYALANFFQNLGVLLASLAAGWLVEVMGVPLTFAVAALGWLVTALLCPWALTPRNPVSVETTSSPLPEQQAQHA